MEESSVPSETESGRLDEAPVQIFTRTSGQCRVKLSISGHFLRIDVSGDILNPEIVDCFREALESGAMRPNMVVLVDLSHFAGDFEWSSIHTIAGLAPWGSEVGRASRIAYVTKSAWFAALLKLVSILFPRSEHRQFSGTHRAIAWLQEKS